MADPQNLPPTNVSSEISNSGSGFSGKKFRYPNPPELGYLSGFSGKKFRFPNPSEPGYLDFNNSVSGFSGKKFCYPNLPDLANPATLRGGWRFAIRQYGRLNSQSWSYVTLVGLSAFALGWVIKGDNPLPEFPSDFQAPSSPKNVPK